ncbi:hypothetical protein PHSC3_000866 [Chlamydiales bacterium STE3]|nr:hypothetical protein PHSC3_000866 [Chlamydiales bacterium STE3]
MDKRDFTKLVLMGMAAGSLIGSQSLTADVQEGEANNYEQYLAGKCGAGSCGGNKPKQPQYPDYTSDNADYSGQSGYQSGSNNPYSTGATGSTGSSNYHKAGTPTQSGNYRSVNPNQGTTQQGQMQEEPSYNNPSTSYPSSIQQDHYLAADEG